MSRQSNDGVIIVIIIMAIFGAIWGFFKIIGAMFEGLEKKKQDTLEKQKLEEKSNLMFPNRVIDTQLSLFERNRDIIKKHEKLITTSSTRYRYGYYYIDNMVRDCINDICLAEGKHNLCPNHSYLSNWKMSAPQEWSYLSSQIEEAFKNRQEKLEEIKEQKIKQEQEESFLNLCSKYSSLITQFNDIVYRKVTTIDDYGEENWDALSKEANSLIEKIAKKEGIEEDDIKDWKKYSFNIPEEYNKLRDKLESGFKKYYKIKKSKPVDNVNVKGMTGVEFENYLAELFKENGYVVTGTPVTGDQGADLIIKKNGKTIIIQAKRYEASVGNGAIQEVIGAIRFYNGDEGWVITNSTFTTSAKTLAQKNDIKLIDGHDLSRIKELI